MKQPHVCVCAFMQTLEDTDMRAHTHTHMSGDIRLHASHTYAGTRMLAYENGCELTNVNVCEDEGFV